MSNVYVAVMLLSSWWARRRCARCSCSLVEGEEHGPALCAPHDHVAPAPFAQDQPRRLQGTEVEGDAAWWQAELQRQFAGGVGTVEPVEKPRSVRADQRLERGRRR